MEAEGGVMHRQLWAYNCCLKVDMEAPLSDKMRSVMEDPEKRKLFYEWLFQKERGKIGPFTTKIDGQDYTVDLVQAGPPVKYTTAQK